MVIGLQLCQFEEFFYLTHKVEGGNEFTLEELGYKPNTCIVMCHIFTEFRN